MMTVAEVHARTTVRRIGSSDRIRCPVHRGHDFNVSFWENEQGHARFKCWSGGCSSRDIEAALGGLPVTQSYAEFKRAEALTTAQRIEKARAIWRQSVSAAGTLVETYLAARGITVTLPPSIRFHPALRHPTGVWLPAMIGGVQGEAGEFTAIHRTWLRADGSGKTGFEPQKAMLGPCAGGAVRLGPASKTVITGEGIETCLSVMQAIRLPTWCALSTSGLITIRLPAIVKTVFMAIDHDATGAGDAAAMRACDRFLAMGLHVRIARPDRVGDFNDLLSGE